MATAVEDSQVADRLKTTVSPTRRPRQALLIATGFAAREGRRAISGSDLRQAVSVPLSAERTWRRTRKFALDAEARRLWEQAEAQPEVLGHPYLAPERIALVGADEVDRTRLLVALGTPFAKRRWWHVRGLHSAARPAAVRERQRRARVAAHRESHGGKS